MYVLEDLPARGVWPTLFLFALLFLFHASRDFSAVSRQGVRPETLQIPPQIIQPIALDRIQATIALRLDVDQPCGLEHFSSAATRQACSPPGLPPAHPRFWAACAKPRICAGGSGLLMLQKLLRKPWLTVSYSLQICQAVRDGQLGPGGMFLRAPRIEIDFLQIAHRLAPQLVEAVGQIARELGVADQERREP